jgi:hypothetical protein
MWEIFTGGEVPYRMKTQTSLIEMLSAGGRLKIPDQTPKVIADCMGMCWKEKPEDRPTFSKLLDLLGGGDEHMKTISTSINPVSAIEPQTYMKTPDLPKIYLKDTQGISTNRIQCTKFVGTDSVREQQGLSATTDNVHSFQTSTTFE